MSANELAGECPLRLTCALNGKCPQTVVNFDTLDGYPNVLVNTRITPLVDYAGSLTVGVFPEPICRDDDGAKLSVFSVNEVSNDWPLRICSGEGALNSDGQLTAQDQRQIRILVAALRGNAWPETLAAATKEIPEAVWTDDFRNLLERGEARPIPTPYALNRASDETRQPAPTVQRRARIPMGWMFHRLQRPKAENE